MVLRDKQVVLGVTGSIACYKAAEIASKLTQAGARVDVVMTAAAREFITPFTFRSLTGRPVFTNMFEPVTDMAEEHVEVARRADLILVAPASATTIARIANGLANDFLSLTVLASRAPLLLAPAMDSQMWEAPATQSNIETLRARGAVIVGPASGRLASGRTGAGRMVDPQEVIGAAVTQLAKRGDLAGKNIVVSAGGTREPIDPVRYISNNSSGKMGYALAEAARDRGAVVTLVTTPTALQPPFGTRVVPVETVAQMREAVLGACRAADALIMAAAVSDFRPVQVGEHKIKKGDGGLTLELVKNENFLLELGDGLVKVAFAAETQNLLENAARKLKDYRVDFICANDVSAADAGFAVDTNRVTILDRGGGVDELPLMSKYDVAVRILDRVKALFERRD